MSTVLIRQYYELRWPIDDPLKQAFLFVDNGLGDAAERRLVAPDDSYIVINGTDLVVEAGRLVSGTAQGISLYDADETLLLTISGLAVDLAAALLLYEDDANATYPLYGPDDAIDFDASVALPRIDGDGLGYFEGSHNSDTLVGWERDDTFYAEGGNDTVWGLGGDDSLSGSSGEDVLYGGDGHDELYGDLGRDSLVGGDGNDRAMGGHDRDTLLGGAGEDNLYGDKGDDSLDGGSGDDYLTGGAGADALIGGSGKDMFWGGSGADRLDGGSGSDIAYYGDKTRKVEIALNGSKEVSVKVNGSVEDRIKNIEGVIGGSAGDKLTGDKYGNYFLGLAGKDTVDGGKGFDRVEFYDKTKKVAVTLNGSKEVIVKVNGKSEDRIKNIEGVTGGQAGDKLTGDSAANWLDGDSGNDTLSGGAGNDTLVGGYGKNVLTGGSGADRFDFLHKVEGSTNFSSIKDFKINTDKIGLSQLAFASLGTSVSKGELAFGTSAKDANDYLIYDRKTGKLYYDSDGSGGEEAKDLIAIFSNKAAIDHKDFMIV